LSFGSQGLGCRKGIMWALIVVVVFVVEMEVNMNYLLLFSHDDTYVSWRCHKKHFFILSNAGKPIYSRSVISVAIEGHRTLV